MKRSILTIRESSSTISLFSTILSSPNHVIFDKIRNLKFFTKLFCPDFVTLQCILGVFVSILYLLVKISYLDYSKGFIKKVLYLCAAICFISLATCQSYRRQRSAVEHHDVEDGTSHYEYLNSLHEHKSIPYNFGYDIKDDKGFNHWHKEESDEHNVKKGSYGYTDAYGIYRHVDYIADHDGFRATVRTNEPGTANYSPAHAHYHVDLPPPDVYKSYSTLKHVDDLPEEYEDKITGTNKRFSLVPVYDSHKSFEE